MAPCRRTSYRNSEEFDEELSHFHQMTSHLPTIDEDAEWSSDPEEKPEHHMVLRIESNVLLESRLDDMYNATMSAARQNTPKKSRGNLFKRDNQPLSFSPLHASTPSLNRDPALRKILGQSHAFTWPSQKSSGRILKISRNSRLLRPMRRLAAKLQQRFKMALSGQSSVSIAV